MAVCDAVSLEVVERITKVRDVAFPYVPGLLSFREAPPLLVALEALRSHVDLMLVDGHGMAHPERFGLACHLGVVTGLATVGVAKSVLSGVHGPLPVRRGSSVPLIDGGEVIGAVVRTRSGVRPVFVSVGHRVTLETAVRVVLECSPRYRIPEPIRQADRLARGNS